MKYFDRKNCRAPEDLADETFNRVMRWLEQEGKEHDLEPAKICYNTARFVFHEYLRKADREAEDFNELPSTKQPLESPHTIAEIMEEQAEQEEQLACLESCSQKLPAADFDLILRYYYGEQRVKLDQRKALAAAHGMSASTLSVRTCRIRNKLRDCVIKCLRKKKQ